MRTPVLVAIALADAPAHDPRDRLVSRRLEYLLGFWRSFPEFAAEWPDWDEYSQQDFIIEWPLMREAYNLIERTANVRGLSEDEAAAWAEVRRLMEMHRMEMEAMLGHPL